MNAEPPPTRGFTVCVWLMAAAGLAGFSAGIVLMKLRHMEPQVAVIQEVKTENQRVSELGRALQQAQEELAGLREQNLRQKDEAAANGEERELWLASQGQVLQKQTRELEYLRVKASRLDADLRDLVRRYTLVMDELAKVNLAPPTAGDGVTGSGATLSLSSDKPVAVSTGYVPPYRPPTRRMGDQATGAAVIDQPGSSVVEPFAR